MKKAGPRKWTGTAPPVVGYMEFSGDYGIQVPDTWFYDIAWSWLWKLFSSSVLHRWGELGGAGGEVTHHRIDRICQAKICIFKCYWAAFFKDRLLFFLLTFFCLERQKAPQIQTEHNSGQLLFSEAVRHRIYDVQLLWRAVMFAPCHSTVRAQNWMAWLEITNWVWIFIVLQCQKL